MYCGIGQKVQQNSVNVCQKVMSSRVETYVIVERVEDNVVSKKLKLYKLEVNMAVSCYLRRSFSSQNIHHIGLKEANKIADKNFYNAIINQTREGGSRKAYEEMEDTLGKVGKVAGFIIVSGSGIGFYSLRRPFKKPR